MVFLKAKATAGHSGALACEETGYAASSLQGTARNIALCVTEAPPGDAIEAQHVCF